MTTRYFQPPEHAPSRLPADTSAPVVVVGGGPVGMATALGLAHRGIRVLVLEAGTRVSHGSRAICVSRHSLEVADRLGLGDRIAQRALAWQGGRSFLRDQEVLQFRMPYEEHDLHPPMVNISQSELEQIMLDELVAHPLVNLYWGCRVDDLKQTTEGVQLEVETAEGRRSVSAGRVVAADGARSRMRELAGLTLRGTSYEGRYVIADIHWVVDRPTERMVWFDSPSNPGSTVIMHRQPNDIWRIDYQIASDADVEMTEPQVRDRIQRHLAWLENHTPWTLEWFSFYKAHALALDDFLCERVVFAGDAAHLVPIFGVRGLNSGLEDSETLAWMLAAVVHGDADEHLLASYAAERRDAWEQNVAKAERSTLVMTPGSDGRRAIRNALLDLAVVRPEFRHLIDPRQSNATHARRSDLTIRHDGAGVSPGDPMEDRRVTMPDGKERSVHELRGSGFAIYIATPSQRGLADAERLRSVIAEALPREGVVVVPIEAASVLEAWQAAPDETIVVRPDGLVIARGRSEELGGVVSRITGSDPSAARTNSPDPEALSPDEVAREQNWLVLSEALDAAPASEHIGVLTRLALVLADHAGPDRLRAALTDVAHSR